ncbi:hypothetical protein [Streptomyces jeddahensis]|nr:hypothetical protein [Streptomyces jeddahensis]
MLVPRLRPVERRHAGMPSREHVAKGLGIVCDPKAYTTRHPA